jgi:hypothetical protein
MGNKALSILATVVAVSAASPAMAAPHFFNAGQTVNVVGIGDINGTECVATIRGTVGPSLGLPAPHVNHSDRINAAITNTGPGACAVVAFPTVVLFADGSLNLTGNATINSICSVASVPVSYGAGTVFITPSTNVATTLAYGSCTLSLIASDASLGFHS